MSLRFSHASHLQLSHVEMKCLPPTQSDLTDDPFLPGRENMANLRDYNVCPVGLQVPFGEKVGPLAVGRFWMFLE